MKLKFNIIAPVFILAVLVLGACDAGNAETAKQVGSSASASPAVTTDIAAEVPVPEPSPAIPNLQRELLDERNKTTTSPIESIEFKNFSYEMPRGWENQDGSEITLVNGKVQPVSVDIDEEMTPEEKAERRSRRRIGLSYVTTKYFDATGDGQDEAIVILKIETGGTAIPQVVYVFEWKDGQAEKLWMFRTGDRADGGLKDIRSEGGMIVVELYGQDRFILGSVETGKITGDEEQLCCPTFFTRSTYKWNGNTFLMQGKRLTYSVADSTAPPLENHGDIMNDPVKSKKYLSTPRPIR